MWWMFAAALAAPVTQSTLFDELWGFGDGTTGGLGGEPYVVDRTDDADVPGTLRYGVESLTGPTWIVFDPTVFPTNRPTAITLHAPLNLRSDTTIDGRGAQVLLEKRYDWVDATWSQTASGTWECDAVPAPTRDMGPMLKLRSVTNVVISHLRLLQTYDGTPPQPGSPTPAELDKQCFGDVVSIYNTASDQATRAYDDIWLNHLDFRACGDECVSITRASLLGRAHLTISNNRFEDTFKAILLGGANTPAYGIAASLYRNHFVGNSQRQPRVQNAVARVENNVFEDWSLYGIGVFDHTRVLVQQNLALAGSQPRQAWLTYSTTDAFLWARDNQLVGLTTPSDYQTSSFPQCQQQGGPWYHDCSTPLVDLTQVPPARLVRAARRWAGWRAVPSDIAFP
jgi:pectate lyase